MNNDNKKLLIYILISATLLVVYLFSPIESPNMYPSKFAFIATEDISHRPSKELDFPIFKSISTETKHEINNKKTNINEGYGILESRGTYSSLTTNENTSLIPIYTSQNNDNFEQAINTQPDANFVQNKVQLNYNRTRKNNNEVALNMVFPSELTLNTKTEFLNNVNSNEPIYQYSNENQRQGIISPGGDEDIDPTPIPIGDSYFLYFLSVGYIIFILIRIRLFKIKKVNHLND